MKISKKTQRKRNIPWFRRGASGIGGMMGFLIGAKTMCVSANYTPTKEYYLKASDFFVQNTIIKSAFRYIGWLLVKGLYYLCYGCEYLYSKSFELLDFTTWGKLGRWIDTFRPVWIALMCLSLAALGIMMIVTHKKQAKLMQNVVLAIFILTSSSIALHSLNQLILSGKNALFETKGATTIQVIQRNMYSLVELDKKIGLVNLTNENATPVEHLTETDIKLLDPAQTQNYSSDNLTTKEAKGEEGILGKRLEVRGDGEYDLGKVKNGYGWNTADDEDFGNEFYYRFKFNWFSIYTEYLALIIVFLCLAYKVTRIVYEITFGRILAYWYSAELSGGKKIAKILCGIRDNYIVLMFTMILVKIFLFGSEYISGMFQENGIKNMIAKGFFLLFLAFCTIDGPNLIEKVTGIDAGLSSGFGKIMALRAAASGIAHGGMAAGTKAKNTGMALLTGKNAMERRADGSFSERMAKGVHNALKEKDNGNKRDEVSGNSTTGNTVDSSSSSMENGKTKGESKGSNQRVGSSGNLSSNPRIESSSLGEKIPSGKSDERRKIFGNRMGEDSGERQEKGSSNGISGKESLNSLFQEGEAREGVATESNPSTEFAFSESDNSHPEEGISEYLELGESGRTEEGIESITAGERSFSLNGKEVTAEKTFIAEGKGGRENFSKINKNFYKEELKYTKKENLQPAKEKPTAKKTQRESGKIKKASFLNSQRKGE